MEGSNSVLLKVPGLVSTSFSTEAGMAMASIYQRLSCFGNISAMTMLRDPVASLLISFTDPSVAATVRDTFGDSWHTEGSGLALDQLNHVPAPAVSSPWDAAHINVATAGKLMPTPSVSSDDPQSDTETASGKSVSGEACEVRSDALKQESLPVLPNPQKSKPRFLNGLELSQLNWDRLANGQEWRRDLLLRGLPRQLCEKGSLELFLAEHGLQKDVARVRLMPGRAARCGAAVVRAASSQAACRIAKLLHGAQFAGLRSPIAVSFAAQKAPAHGRTMEPMRVGSSQAPRSGLTTGVEPPPGL